MTDQKPIVERRKHKRFAVMEGANMAFVPYFSKQGPVIDISEGGLAFRYISAKKILWRELIAILIDRMELFLKDVPFKTVYDLKMKHVNFFGVKSIRRCGGEFGELTSSQTAKLEYFIKNYTSLSKM
ncbi:MAG: PilZ domain-containing protein [Desulfobacterales bacterium]